MKMRFTYENFWVLVDYVKREKGLDYETAYELTLEWFTLKGYEIVEKLEEGFV